MAEDKMFQEALEAINQGQRARSRDLLTRLLRTNPSKADYWLWMSTVVNTVNEKVYCLESALKADPENQAARQGLVILDARPADANVTPVPPIRRKWAADLEKELEPPKNLIQRIWSNPLLRLFSFIGAGIVVFGLVMLGIFGIRRQQEILMIRVTPFATSTRSDTATPLPTKTLVVRSPTPTYIGPTPLWMFLTETYTPVPLYVNTPHPLVEAYRAGIRAYERNDLRKMLDFMQQSSQVDPNSPDFFYYEGEAQRLMGNYDQAITAYDQALTVNPAFAPAYLGRARASQGLNPRADVIEDLNLAIQYDPYMVDAYLDRAAYLFQHGEPETAIDDLLTVESLNPQSPMLYVLRAKVNLAMGDHVTALQNAQQGYDLDRTLLEAYLVLAQAYLANEDAKQARHFAEFYLRYAPQDATGRLLIGKASYIEGDYQAAILALDQVIELDDTLAEAYRYRGLSYLALNEAQLAINDLVVVVQSEPANYLYTMELAQALWNADRLTDAYRTYSSAENLAADDSQLAAVYFHRAQVAEAALNLLDAIADWKSLLALPQESVLAEWRTFAQSRLDTIIPPTLTPTPTQTPLPTVTPTPSQTPIPTPTPSPTTTSTATITPNTSPTSATPSPTRTPTRTPRITPTQ